MELLEKVIEVAGGRVWKQPRSLKLNGQARFSPYGKIEDGFLFDTYRLYRVFPTANTAAQQANGKVRIDAFYGEQVFFQLKFNGQKTAVDLSPAAAPYANHFKWTNNFGFGIIRFWDHPNLQIESLAADQVEGHPCHFIKITDADQKDTFFGIDQAQHFIRMVGFSTELGWHHRIYSNFQRATNDFLQASRVRLYFDGIKWMDIDWQHFMVNESIATKTFD